MASGDDAGRMRRAAWTTAGGGLLVTAMMAWATVPSEGWVTMAPLFPIGFFAGSLAGGLLAGTIWFSGVAEDGSAEDPGFGTPGAKAARHPSSAARVRQTQEA